MCVLQIDVVIEIQFVLQVAVLRVILEVIRKHCDILKLLNLLKLFQKLKFFCSHDSSAQQEAQKFVETSREFGVNCTHHVDEGAFHYVDVNALRTFRND